MELDASKVTRQRQLYKGKRMWHHKRVEEAVIADEGIDERSSGDNSRT